MSELLKKAIEKCLSARFIMAILFSATYCVIMLGCTLALIKKIISVETYVAILASFVLVMREISDAYFKRIDRPSVDTTNGTK